MRELDELIENHPTLAENIILDQTRIGKIMGFSFFLQFVKIVIIICCCSYFFALFFKFLCEIQNEYKGWDNFGDGSDEEEHFTSYYGI
jgi:hypothetical protein